MAEKPKQIIPIGGGGFYRDPENLELEKYIIRQTGVESPRIAFVPTASGEPDHYVAVWRDWGVVEILREAWQSGIVLTGVSAGAICWFEQGLTDSFSDGLRPLECLGFLPGNCCPHYDGEAQRRPALHRLLLSGEIPAGIAIEDWVGVHFIGTEIHKVIAAKRGARAYSMRAVYGSVQEVPLEAEFLGA